MKKNTRNVLILLGLLLEFAFALLGGVVLGYMIDQWKGTTPIFTIIMLVFGSIASFSIFFKIFLRVKKTMEKEND